MKPTITARRLAQQRAMEEPQPTVLGHMNTAQFIDEVRNQEKQAIAQGEDQLVVQGVPVTALESLPWRTDLFLRIPVTIDGNTPTTTNLRDMTGHTTYFTAKGLLSDPDPGVFQKTSLGATPAITYVVGNSSETPDGVTANVVRIHIAHPDTTSVAGSVELIFDALTITPAGNAYQLAQGVLPIYRTITETRPA